MSDRTQAVREGRKGDGVPLPVKEGRFSATCIKVDMTGVHLYMNGVKVDVGHVDLYMAHVKVDMARVDPNMNGIKVDMGRVDLYVARRDVDIARVHLYVNRGRVEVDGIKVDMACGKVVVGEVEVDADNIALDARCDGPAGTREEAIAIYVERHGSSSMRGACGTML